MEINKMINSNIDKENKIPYYFQIFKDISDHIKNGKLKEGDKLPNEMDLCTEYDVSRTTVRLALKELELRNLIHRERGRGTFVSKRIIETKSLQKVSSIVDELKKEGVETRSEILSKKIIVPSERIRENLAIDESDKVLYVKRLMIAFDEPMYVTKAYLPYDIFKDIEIMNLKNKSFTRIVEEDFKIHISYIKRILEPDIPDDEIAKLLGIGDKQKKVIHYLQTYWMLKHNSERRIIYFEEYFNSTKGKFIFEQKNMDW